MSADNFQDQASSLSKSLITSEWIVIGASVQGSHHLAENQPCQDAFDFRVTGQDALILAIADGLGSASQASQGAQMAVSIALDITDQSLKLKGPVTPIEWEDLFKEAFERVHKTLVDESTRQQLDIHEFATTLILAAMTPECLVVGHIGDGAVIALDPLGVLSTVSGPNNGEYINDTFPITLPNVLELARFQTFPMMANGLAVISDGLQRLSLHQFDDSPHAPFFDPLFNQMPRIENGATAAAMLSDFLMSPRVNQLTGDDKTLVLARRKIVS